MKNPNAFNTAMEAVYLAGCALHDQTPQVKPQTDWNGLFRFCQSHSITAMVTMALEQYWQQVPSDTSEERKPWLQARDMAIRKNILLNAERQRILSWMEEVGCWYLPLKGSILQFDYPKFGMRQMCDNDILFDKAFQQRLREHMLENGYHIISYGVGHHDVYDKAPVFKFEFHTKLFAKEDQPALYRYYEDPLRCLYPDEHKKFGRCMNAEEFYIYMTAHAFHHEALGSIGIRSLMDTFVYLQKYQDQMDMDFVEDRLESMGILDFHRKCVRLARRLFAEPTRADVLTEEEKQVLVKIFAAGTYGTADQWINNNLDRMEEKSQGKGVRLKYFFSRVFPSPSMIMDYDPSIRRNKWKLIPFYFKRLWRAIVEQPKVTLHELSVIRKRKKP